MVFLSDKEKEMKMKISKKSSITGGASHAAQFVLLIVSISCVSNIASAAERWVGTWATGQQLVENNNNPASPYLANNTLRQIVHATIGGSRIRVHFSNKYSTGATTINSAHIALSNSGIPINSSIDTATDTALTFNNGSASVTIPAGQELYSDAVDFNVPPLSNLTVSIYFGTASSTSVTGHPGSRTAYYLKTGNTVSDANMQSGYKTEHWYVLSRIDLWLDDSYGCAVTLGDSITDGRGCTPNYNNRWPDNLASRLHADANTAKVGVINQGIGGNTVLSGGLGPTALVRFNHDVNEQPGVRWVLILEGVNDLGSAGSVSIVDSLTNAYQKFIDGAHARKILVYGIPILPFKNSGYANGNPSRLTWRNSINNWIRTIGKFDAVIDLDPAVWDPADHEKLNPAYLYQNDYLHLNVAGQQAMANANDHALFKQTAELNKDGSVNFVDFAVLGDQWLQEPTFPSADIAPLGGDWVVDFEDFYLMAQEWLIVE
jgi:lysophospholipase L1-like esterase